MAVEDVRVKVCRNIHLGFDERYLSYKIGGEGTACNGPVPGQAFMGGLGRSLATFNDNVAALLHLYS